MSMTWLISVSRGFDGRDLSGDDDLFVLRGDFQRDVHGGGLAYFEDDSFVHGGGESGEGDGEFIGRREANWG